MLMIKIIQLLIVCLLPIIVIGQKVIPPKWEDNITEYNTAKIRIFDTKTKKSLPEEYKDSKVILKGVIDGDVSTITINVSDKFYIKDGTILTVSYEKKTSGNESVTYTLEEGDKLALIAIYWDLLSDTPSRIFITYDERVGKTIKSSGSFTIFEFKE
jgi:hypothetical protein